jgi:putative phosphoesterase
MMATGELKTGTTRQIALPGGRDVTIGVISDTHGLLRADVVAALAGCDLIIHAGDIGSREVLHRLAAIAPVVAVRGNTDRVDRLADVPATEVADVGGCLVYVLHDLHLLDLDPVAAGICVVISGHSHQPARYEKDGILYLNPGSCGPKRFRCPVSMARLRIVKRVPAAELIELPE